MVKLFLTVAETTMYEASNSNIICNNEGSSPEHLIRILKNLQNPTQFQARELNILS